MLNIDMKCCTGCGTCENVCSQNAIRMVESDRGFLYPAFDESLCIECGLCEKKWSAVSYGVEKLYTWTCEKV